MASVAVLAFGTRGDVEPLAAVARWLAGAGWEVTLVSHAQHSPWLATCAGPSVRLDFVQTPPAVSSTLPQKRYGLWSPAHFDVVYEACFRADRVVFNLFAIGEGLHACDVLNKPCVAAHPYTVSNDDAAKRRCLQRLQRREPQLVRRLGRNSRRNAADDDIASEGKDRLLAREDVDLWVWPALADPLWTAFRRLCVSRLAGGGGAAAAALASLLETGDGDSPPHALANFWRRRKAPTLLYGYPSSLLARPGYWPETVRLCGWWRIEEGRSDAALGSDAARQSDFSDCGPDDTNSDDSDSADGSPDGGDQPRAHRGADEGDATAGTPTAGNPTAGDPMAGDPKASDLTTSDPDDDIVAFASSPRGDGCHDAPILWSLGAAAGALGLADAGTLERLYEALDEALFLFHRHAILHSDACGVASRRYGAVDAGPVLVVDHGRSFDYPRVVRRCAVFIHHGGSGSTAAAAYAGVPSLIIPFAFDQFTWAEVVEHKGLGKRLDARNVTAEALAKTLRCLLSPQARLRALCFSRDVRAQGTSSLDAVEAALRDADAGRHGRPRDGASRGDSAGCVEAPSDGGSGDAGSESSESDSESGSDDLAVTELDCGACVSLPPAAAENETNFILEEIFGQRCYDAFGTLEALRDAAAKGERVTIVDVGAHVGLFAVHVALELAQDIDRIRVVAFEPNPASFQKLEPNLRRYVGKRGVADSAALGGPAKGGARTAVLECFPRLPGNSTLRSEEKRRKHHIADASMLKGARRETVLLETLDDALVRCGVDGRVALLKVDVEGSEHDVLRGALNMLKRTDRVAVEVHDVDGRLALCSRLLEARGFCVRAVDGCTSTNFLIFAWRQAVGNGT
ncbi:hypothetical protein M885DRAFT_522194 [Pelagophyceae sp. CCMP2097]|nr:hypothetical protein M885DRAFT_522194 [Pelagophyceae sp. CCMP2097]